MKNSKIERIKALNLTEGEVITLEKAKDRKELEMISTVLSTREGNCNGINDNGNCGSKCNVDVCVTKFCDCNGAKCSDCYDCFLDFVCDCKGPIGYQDSGTNCRPWTNCNPVCPQVK